MCGIAGYSCWQEYDSRINVALPILAIAMEQRGRRSWGWTNGEDEIVKDTGTISDSFNPSFFGYKHAALHTRQPTTGEVIKENSHPFKVGNIIGMHNGVVRNHDELQKKYSRDCKVDSEHIFRHINEGLPLDEISAYGAIVFWQDGKLHLGRFNGGELSLARTPNAFVFASTRDALKVALQYSGLSEGAVYYKLKEDQLYVIEGNVVKRDRKLEFAHYSTKVHGDWRSNSQGQSGGRTDAGFFPTSPTSYQQRTKNGCTGADNAGFVVNDRRRDFGSGIRSTDNAPLTQMGLPSDVTDATAYVSSTERIREMLEVALKQEEHKHSKSSWGCDMCSIKIFEGDTYQLTANGEMLCANCADTFEDEVCGKPLVVLPEEIGKVSSFFGDIKGRKMECEECTEMLEGDEFFVFTQDKAYVCIPCFTDANSDDDGDDDIAEAEVIVDTPHEAESIYAAQQQERLDIIVGEHEQARQDEAADSTLVNAVAERAERLKQLTTAEEARATTTALTTTSDLPKPLTMMDCLTTKVQ